MLIDARVYEVFKGLEDLKVGKSISSFGARDIELITKIVRLADERQESVKSFLNQLGYELVDIISNASSVVTPVITSTQVVTSTQAPTENVRKNRKRNKIDEKLTIELLNMYPNGVVGTLSKDSYSLYWKVQSRARSKAVSKNVRDYIESLEIGNGVYLKYSPGRVINRKKKQKLSSIDFQFTSELAKLYPSGVITRLSSDHERLYWKIKDHVRSKETSKTIKDYIESLEVSPGVKFIYARGLVRNAKVDVSSNLKDLYPNGIVTGLIDRNLNLYSYISYQAKKKKITIKDYIENLEFEPGKRFKYFKYSGKVNIK
jgi:hypothetical protein